jgi:hypothetical protein
VMIAVPGSLQELLHMAAVLLDQEASCRVRVTSAGSQPADQLNPAVVQAPVAEIATAP